MLKILFLILYFAENGNFIVERIYPNSRKNRCPEWAFSSLWSTLRILRFSKTWKPFLHWITPNTKYCSVFKRQMTVKWKCMWTVWCKSIRQCSPKSSTAAKMSVSIPRSTTCIRGTRRPITNMYWSQTVVSEVSSNITGYRDCMIVNYSFSLITVRPDTLADMVSHMTKSVGLVHQMPFACDRTGLPATLEKVITWLTSLINHIFVS